MYGRYLGLGYFGYEFDHSMLDVSEVGEFFVHVVDGYMESATLCLELLEGFTVKAVGFAHKTAETVAVHGVLMQGFGCPNHDLSFSFGRQNMRTQRPDDVAVALGTGGCYTQITAEAHGLIKGASHVKQLYS